MATLEVHDDAGRVQFIELARDHPSLFGTSSACDIALSGAGVNAVHGRIRWKKGRYRVEASPDAQFVLINGHRMASASLHEGDELKVGGCKMLVKSLDLDALAQPDQRRPRHTDEERTRVLEGPLHVGLTQPEPRDAAAKGQGVAPRRAKESMLERGDWLRELELEDDEDTASQTAQQRSTPRATGRTGPWRSPSSKGQPGSHWLASWLGKVRDRRERAPGQERIVSSPLVLGLILSLGLLVLLGLALRSIIVKTLANQRYGRAVEVLEDGDYRTAIRDFDSFLAAHPEDPRVGKARVLRGMANVRQYVSVSGGTWSTALEAADAMYQTFGADPEFRDERMELADLVIRIGEGLADRARRAADAKALREAESAVPLHAQIAGEPAPAFLKRSRLPDLLDAARASVRKSQIRAVAILAMDAAIQNGSASAVYKARDDLVDQYADLAQDREVVGRMTQANDLIRRAVKVNPTRLAAATTERPETLGPLTSLVLRSSAESSPTPPAASAIVFALADGLAYALDAANGAPLWQRSVGLASPFVPIAVPGDPTALAVDARHHELLRLDSRTGRLLWRLELGEPVESPPLILGEQLFQVLPSGKLITIALASGERQSTLDLGLPLARAPASDEQGRFFYLVARRNCLFVIGRDPLSCLGVEYLGHEDGAIACTPLRLGRFLVVVENDRPSDSRWRVLVLDDEGAKVRLVQDIGVPGWTWNSPPSSGSVVWATGDKGGVEAYGLGDYASKSPFRSLARLNPDASASGPAFGLAGSERELWLGAGRSGRYELDPERGEIIGAVGTRSIGPGPCAAANRGAAGRADIPGSRNRGNLGPSPGF